MTGDETRGEAEVAGCVVPKRHPRDAAMCVDSCWQERVKGEPCAARIADLIERSSLGTPEAKALRATVSDEHAARIVAAAEAMSAPVAEPADDNGLYLILAATRGLSIDGCNDLIDRLRPWLARRDAERDRARDAEARRVVEAVLPEVCQISRTPGIVCTDYIGGEFGNGVFVAEMCCLPCRVRQALAEIEEGSP